MAKPSDKPMDAYVRVSRVSERGGDPAYGSPHIQRDAIEWWARVARSHLRARS